MQGRLNGAGTYSMFIGATPGGDKHRYFSMVGRSLLELPRALQGQGAQCRLPNSRSHNWSPSWPDNIQRHFEMTGCSA